MIRTQRSTNETRKKTGRSSLASSVEHIVSLLLPWLDFSVQFSSRFANDAQNVNDLARRSLKEF